MALITWNDKLSVNIKSIDDQHKKLITMINDFYDNIVNRSNQENLIHLIASLKEYIQEHFSLEESHMEKLHFYGYRQHKKEHAFFISKVNEIEEKLNSGKTVLSLDATMFLYDWLKNHIMITDQKYSEIFIENGIQ